MTTHSNRFVERKIRAGLRVTRLFVAYAPFDDPKYAISVLVEHGGFGAAAAAPRAREIMRLALLKDPDVRKRIERPLPMPELPSDMGPADGPNVAPDATQAMAPAPEKPA